MYSAESIILALKSNEELQCEGINAISCPSLHIACGGEPDNCDIGIDQKCKQPVAIHQHYKKLIVLNFRFMVSCKNHSGFIRIDDSALRRLIDHNLIDKSILKPA